MRIAIFDGILETHVASSLERAFRARGHHVWSSGRIGHGFKFPLPHEDTSHLAHAVGQVLNFQPDLVFVMRPASLPSPLLKKLKRSGATLMAWFSDDPVLFDLSYGPIVNSYDHILHCGNSKVLAFYEERFQRPTGVNIPFWTDHTAFPTVWGSEDPDCDLMFLGNMHDEVRRARYFTLTELRSSLRIHGNVGADFLGLSAGFLDHDSEVVAAGARARIALNIPQFFKDHRGLETWFQGLDSLGFFEYPSRVVQYMAMGIPTISIIPDGAPEDFRSFPEMLVVPDVASADALAQELIHSGALQDLSRRTAARFDRYFSATSRVLAIESLLESDDWKSLTPSEREVWFTQFDASVMAVEAVEIAPRDHIDSWGVPTADRSAANPLSPRGAITIRKGENPGASLESARRHIILAGFGWTQESSRLRAVLESFEQLGHDVTHANPARYPKLFVPDPAKRTKHAINVHHLHKLQALPEGALLVVCGVDASLTESGMHLLQQRSVVSVLIDDTGRLDLDIAIRLASRYSVLATQSYELQQHLERRGFTNVVYFPHFVAPRYLDLLETVENKKPAVHVRAGVSEEESICPAMLTDTQDGTAETFTYQELEQLSLDELAHALHADVALLSPMGTRGAPKVHPLAAYVAVSADWLFHSRTAITERLHPYALLGTSVERVGELAIKARRLADSPLLQSATQHNRDVSLGLLRNGTENVSRLLEKVAAVGELNHQVLPLEKAAILPVPLEMTAPAQHSSGHVIELRLQSLMGHVSDWWVRILASGRAIQAFQGADSLRLVVTRPLETTDISLELLYRGPAQRIELTSAVRATATITPVQFDASHTAVAQRVLELDRTI